MLNEQQWEEFRSEGYLLVPDALADIGLERVQNAYEAVRRQTEAAWRRAVAADTGKGVYGLGAAAHVMPDLYQYDPLFLDLANNPAVIPLVESVVGRDLQLTEMIGHNHPASTEAHVEWHRDWPPWSHPTQILKAKVFYYLDDITEDMGAFSVVPGSHTWPADPPGPPNSFADGPSIEEPSYVGAQLEKMPDMKKITAPAGTAVIWNVALWHTATANTSPRDRRMIAYGYTHFWVKQWEDRTPPEEIIAWADTPQKRQLMGIHAVQGRAAWDRRDVAYLPEHKAIADAKPF
jgi:ectoine hydroxylase-related dioxygenase (phytanoyl-CoA dioxygenase family)